MPTGWKKGLLSNSRLYLILDKDSCYQGNPVAVFRKVAKDSIDLVQLRENTANTRDFLRDAGIIKRLSKRRIIFLINNRLDIALLSGADGLHLGQSDLPLASARRALGRDKIIGISCRNLAQALRAQEQGADYVSIGPIFPTPLKPDLNPLGLGLIRKIKANIKIPFFVIGGINRSNINKVVSSGAGRVAVCRAICQARNIKRAGRDIRGIIDSLTLNKAN
jgi:thiamine-phosphate pyrophosphorylase